MDRPPPAIPDYELLRRIGRGSYGEVWLARSVTAIYRAVKIIYRAQFADDRPYEREFAGIKRFEVVSRSHESQVDIFHVGRNDAGGYFYYVMELADDDGAQGDRNQNESGGKNTTSDTPALRSPAQVHPDTYAPKTLKSVLAKRGHLPVSECLPVGLALADALAHLHTHGLVHRDVKPSNIIFVNGRPKLADIGLLVGADATRSFVGTEGFTPPEGPGTTQADVFSLGKVFYEMSTGRDRLDFPHLPENLDDLPDRAGFLEFNEVVIRACDRDPRNRHASAKELRSDLLLLQAGKSVRRLRLLESRARAVLPAAAALFAGVLVIVSFQHFQTREARRIAAVETLRRREAQEQHLATRQLLYAANLNLAQQAFDVGDLGHMRELLSESAPRDGEPDLRGWEWRWFWQKTRGDQLFTFTGHSNSVNRVGVSPDGRLIASAGYDHTVRIWEVAGRRELACWRTGDEVEETAFTPDGAAVIYSEVTGRISLRRLDAAQPEMITQSSVTRLVASPVGSLISLSRGDYNTDNTSAVEVWDYARRERVWRFENAGWETAFSVDGRWLATSGNNEPVRIRDLPSGQVLATLPAKPRQPHMCFSPDGSALAVVDDEGAIELWNTTTAARLKKLSGPVGQVWQIAFSPDGKLLASAGTDQTIRLWNLETSEVIAVRRGHLSEVWSVQFMPDGQTLVSGGKDGTVRLWPVHSTAQHDVLSTDLDFWQWPVFSADSRWIAAGTRTNGVCVWRVSDGQPLAAEPQLTRAVLFSTADATLWCLNAKNELQAWPWQSVGAQPGSPLPRGLERVRAHAVSDDGRRVAFAERSGRVIVFDVPSWRQLWSTNAHRADVSRLAFSPNGKWLVSVSEAESDGCLWDAERGLFLHRLPGHKLAQYGAEFSPAGGLMATSSVDDTCILRDAASGDPLAVLRGHHGGAYGLSFSRDGRTLAVGCNDGQIKLWNVTTRRDLVTLHTAPHAVFDVRFAPDGRTLAAVSFNHATTECTLRLWHNED